MEWTKLMVIVLFLMSLLPRAFIVLPAYAVSDLVETAALMAFKQAQPDPSKQLSNWQGSDPCGSSWHGIICGSSNATTNMSHVIEIRTMNFGLGGTLVPELGNMTQLQILNVINNNMSGSIPPALGKLTNLRLFLVNHNQLSGLIPRELGGLVNMVRFQIDSNDISGSIPPELGNLTSCNHLHMNNNSISGIIPSDLGRLPQLSHLILEYNKVTGPLPMELANISTLTIIQLDNNPIGGSVPTNWFQIPTLLKLSVRNCSLSGTIPELGTMQNLTFIDLSENNLTGPLPSNFSQLLLSVAFSNNKLSGEIPEQYGTLNQLQSLDFSTNNLTGSIPSTIGTGASFSNSSQYVVVDLQNNDISGWSASTFEAASLTNKSIWLDGNPEMCGSNGLVPQSTQLLTCVSQDSIVQIGGSISISAPSAKSCPSSCSDGSVLVSNVTTNGTGTCRCAVPITVLIRLKSPSFTFIDNYVKYIESLTANALSMDPSLVLLSNSERGIGGLYQQDLTIYLFPASGSNFTLAEYNNLYGLFSSWQVSAGEAWSLSIVGPYDLLNFFSGTAIAATKKNSLSTGAVVGIVVGSVVAVTSLAVLVAILLLRWRWKKRIDDSKTYQGTPLPPGVVIKGVKGFTFAELAKATDGFNLSHELGQGGYGKVYKGILEDGSAVAIKRAKEGSMQGPTQFYTEIELLSRVHHRNLLALLGYCNDRGEQMLVYEFMAGGTLRDHLIPTEVMDFTRRMNIALGTARGILYLHTEADPPIFHRDIKASNILLDERYNPKVADFGLSKLAPIPDLTGVTAQHVSTIVKGTPGYLDPEYFMTQKLTDKTDVYSLGVVLLELITGMMPISHGKNIVLEVKRAMEKGDIMSIADPQMGTYPSEKGLEPLLRLALACCQSESEARPRMVDIVRELEDIWRTTTPFVSNSWKSDSETFSIDMDKFIKGRRGQASGEPSGDSWRDMSALSIETNEQSGDVRGKGSGSVHPR